jgi:hypothetical protein
MPNHNAVPGILAPGEINGKKVNLAPYFTGALASTNTGHNMGESVNFLDGGGAAVSRIIQKFHQTRELC